MAKSYLRSKEKTLGKKMSIRIPEELQFQLETLEKAAAKKKMEVDIEAMALDGIIKGVKKTMKELEA